jgi:hypothetical protein
MLPILFLFLPFCSGGSYNVSVTRASAENTVLNTVKPEDTSTTQPPVAAIAAVPTQNTVANPTAVTSLNNQQVPTTTGSMTWSPNTSATTDTITPTGIPPLQVTASLAIDYTKDENDVITGQIAGNCFDSPITPSFRFIMTGNDYNKINLATPLPNEQPNLYIKSVLSPSPVPLSCTFKQVKVVDEKKESHWSCTQALELPVDDTDFVFYILGVGISNKGLTASLKSEYHSHSCQLAK